MGTTSRNFDLSEIKDISVGKYLQQICSNWREAMQFAGAFTESLHQSNAQYYDRNRIDSPFKLGDLVYVEEFACKIGATRELQNQFRDLTR